MHSMSVDDDRIEKLEEQGISAADTKRLRDAGFLTVASVAMTHRKNLIKIKAISELKADKIKEAAAKLFPTGFSVASELATAEANVIQLSTGSKALDSILDGGIQAGLITELVGDSRSGKTQLCHHLCVTCQLPFDQTGGEGRAVYIDTNNSFCSSRIQSIATRYELDEDLVLENITIARAYNSEHLLQLLNDVNTLMSESRFALLIVDSSINLFRQDYIGRGEMRERQNAQIQFFAKLKLLAEIYGVAVVITNQMARSAPSELEYGEGALKPLGGSIHSHNVNTRIKLGVGKGNLRFAKILQSSKLPEAECTIEISKLGIDDDRD